MAAVDGTIRIDTKLDQQSINDAISKIQGSVGKLQSSIEKFGNLWLGLMAGRTAFDALLAGLDKYNLFWSSLGPKIWDLNWAFQNLQGAWANLLATALEPMIPYLIQFIHWLQGIIQYVTVVIAALFGLDQTMGSIMKKTDMLAAFDKINTLNMRGPAASPPPISVPADLMKKVQDLKKEIVDLWNTISGFVVHNIWEPLSAFLGPIIATIIAQWNVFTEFWQRHLGNLGAIWNDVWGIIWDVAQMAFWGVVWLVGLGVGLITGNWGLLDLAWGKIMGNLKDQGGKTLDLISNYFQIAVDFWKTLWNSPIIQWARVLALDVLKLLLNVLIGLVNSMIRGVTDNINSFIGTVNAIGSIVGMTPLGMIAAPQIPHLASGAVIPPNSSFLAVLGDQKSGNNIEAPESLLRKIVAEELGKQTVNINFGGSLAQLANVLKPYLDKENVRVGNNLVKRTGQVQIS